MDKRKNKTIVIPEELHDKIKEVKDSLSINKFAEEAILYVIRLHQEGKRIIGGVMYEVSATSAINVANNTPTTIESTKSKANSDNDLPPVDGSYML